MGKKEVTVAIVLVDLGKLMTSTANGAASMRKNYSNNINKPTILEQFAIVFAPNIQTPKDCSQLSH